VRLSPISRKWFAMGWIEQTRINLLERAFADRAGARMRGNAAAAATGHRNRGEDAAFFICAARATPWWRALVVLATCPATLT